MGSETIYLDNASATRLDERVLEAMKPYMLEVYAVPGSQFGYSLGIQAREALSEARSSLADFLGASDDEIVFTSGSTESSNLALQGVAASLADRGDHLIVSEIEDFPILKTAQFLEERGYKVTYLPVDSEGFVDPKRVEEALTDRTILVSIQHANQEVGTIQDVSAIAEICRHHGTIFHTDATHTFRRLPLDLQQIPADLVTISAHTLHGPKGVGGLYVRKGTPLNKQIHGGFQEFNLRAGLENIPGAVGFAKAAKLMTEEENKQIEGLRDTLIQDVTEKIPNTSLNGAVENRIPQNANITFHRVEGESITLHLDMKGFAVSTGSACFSRSLEASHVITGIGGDHERAHGSVRFSLGRFNTPQDINKVVDAVGEVVERLRKISPLKEESETQAR